MYIRTKIFQRKGDDKPFFTQEVNGTHAIQLMIVKVAEHFFGAKISEQIKLIFDKELN